MLRGRKDDIEVHVKITSGSSTFKEELSLLKELGGKYNFKTKEWSFPLDKEDMLVEHGVKMPAYDTSIKYPEVTFKKEKIPYVREYQEAPINFALGHGGRVLLALPTGLGKTVTSLAFFDYTEINYPLLIISTASTKTQWRDEYKKFTSGDKKVVILSGIDSVHAYDADVVIVNYDLLSYHIKQIGGNKWDPKFAPTEGLKSLKAMNFRGMIVDECQRMKADTSMWTKAINYLGKGIPYIWALSATFLENKVIESYNVLHLLRPDLFDSYEDFGMRFCNGHRATRWVKRGGRAKQVEYWDYNGASNQEQLHAILKHHLMYRVSKSEALPGLPRAQPTPLFLELSKGEMQEYNDILNGVTEIQTKSGKAMSSDKLVRQNYMREFCGLAKLDYLDQFLLDFLSDNPREKILVFTEHHSVIDHLYNKFKKYSVIFDGRCSLKQKDEAKRKFIEDPECRIIFGNLASMATGNDGFQKVASKMVIAQLPYNPTLITQAIGRLERSGSTADIVTVYFPILKDTVEETILNMITDKSTNLFTILDGADKKDDNNIGKQILELLDKKMV